MESQIRTVLAEHGRLPAGAAGFAREADLYALGLTSHASVNVMLALEDAFDVEFPEPMLRKKTFESIVSIETALRQLGCADAEAGNVLAL